MKKELCITKDGSPTIYVPQLDESYHSMHGSIQEANHVFINNGLKYFKDNKQLRVLEIGFGTGLNALLAAKYAHDNQLMIQYVGLEAYALDKALWQQISYAKTSHEKSWYFNMMSSPWEEESAIHPYFKILKNEIKVQQWETQERFDVVFYDAFGPRAQPEMWQYALFEQLFGLLDDGGILVTYCAQGEFKRNLRDIGYKVESLPGPIGKREMTRAIKINK